MDIPLADKWMFISGIHTFTVPYPSADAPSRLGLTNLWKFVAISVTIHTVDLPVVNQLLSRFEKDSDSR